MVFYFIYCFLGLGDFVVVFGFSLLFKKEHKVVWIQGVQDLEELAGGKND